MLNLRKASARITAESLRSTNALATSRLLSLTSCRHGAELGHKRKTSFYEFHVSKGGKMVDFAGWLMPVVYSDQTIVQSHLHTRKHVSIFDVSHMMQTRIYGKQRIQYTEGITVADIRGLKENQGALTVFTNDRGGILDDLIVTKTNQGYLYIVSNAGCREGDLKHMQDHFASCKSAGLDVGLEVQSNPLIAVQGPGTKKVLQAALNEDFGKLFFMHTMETTVFGVPNCRVTRCGYTGEDGVEISIPEGRESHVMDCLLNSAADSVKLAGLGARDSLRLEAGLCLYGHDIDTMTTPVEASLAWLIGKARRDKADFPGAEVILNQLREKPQRKRVGLVSISGPPPREGAKVYRESQQIGTITSGCPSPSLHKNIAMGYLRTEFSNIGTEVKVEVRGKLFDAVVAKLPFLPSNYYAAAKK